MNITVFTSNHPRHLALLRKLSEISDNVYAFQECKKPAEEKIEVFANYFQKVDDAEKTIFGEVNFLPSNVKQLALIKGDLNNLNIRDYSEAMNSDYYIVFGAGYIKNDWADYLIEHKAINIHMGVSPYFRGSACNFWALNDGYPDLVGATIHLLSKGLDDGAILYHALPVAKEESPFMLGMDAVRVAQDSLVERIKDGTIFDSNEVEQKKSEEIRYSKGKDFTEEIVRNYLSNMMSDLEVKVACEKRNLDNLVRPFIG